KNVQYHLDVLGRDDYITRHSPAGWAISPGGGSTSWDAKFRLTSLGKQRVVEGYRPTLGTSMSNNISVHISESTIGMLNTGQLENVQSISVNVSTLADRGQAEVAEALKQVTEAVTASQEINSDNRDELLDYLEELSKQAALEPAQRAKPSII